MMIMIVLMIRVVMMIIVMMIIVVKMMIVLIIMVVIVTTINPKHHIIKRILIKVTRLWVEALSEVST